MSILFFVFQLYSHWSIYLNSDSILIYIWIVSVIQFPFLNTIFNQIPDNNKRTSIKHILLFTKSDIGGMSQLCQIIKFYRKKWDKRQTRRHLISFCLLGNHDSLVVSQIRFDVCLVCPAQLKLTFSDPLHSYSYYHSGFEGCQLNYHRLGKV